MNDEAIALLIEKQPDLKGSQEKLKAMQPGAYCMHRSWGFGQIKEYDEATEKLIIDFDDKAGHPMAPAFCVDKLDILADTNILVRASKEPDVIKEMIKKQPEELIKEILRHCPDLAASTAEIENLLRKVIGDTTYKRWWTKTKKLLVKDPDIQTPSKKHEPYILRDEPLAPEQEILEEFYMIKHPLKKIRLAEKLHELSDNVDEIRKDLPQILETITNHIKESRQLNQSERLYGMWVRNDLARHLEREKIVTEHGEKEPENLAELVEEVINNFEPTSRSLIIEEENLSELAENLPSAYNKRFLDLITRVFPEDWEERCVQLLRYSEGRFTQECVSFLVDRDMTDHVAMSFDKWLKEQSLRAPLLMWIAKNRNSRKFGKLVKGLVGTALFSAILNAIDNEALQSTSSRRIPLADILSEDQELIRDLLENSDAETARDLAQVLMLNQGFEDLSKKSLMARFIKLYPKIQSLLESESQTASDQLIVSQESLDKRKAEYDHLVNVLLPENIKAIETAKEHGDLKENSEYKMARQDNDTLTARRANLETEMGKARVTDFTEATTESVGIGCIVSLIDESGKSQTFTLLGAWDSQPEKNIISYKTPLGQSLLSKSTGESASIHIDGENNTWTIQSIERWVDKK